MDVPATTEDVKESAESITVRVRDQTGEETFFKIKKTTKMQKVFETYATRKGVQVNSLRFLLDGDRITPDQTPKMLELEDQDQIDCVLEQTGGKGHGQIGAAAQ
ncbi:small ubiquitin-like modifier [Phaeodactylum tricornutum CCAP 1055/1]|jgi:small ubiquitin-related modifier|uniref:Small ubiquitin-like modifier n=3 Tax=Phaeodactylum tricornutum TaxID=2850 RepID=B7G0R2_PHATC|nr:small ubiquitin-like modifier [Phaeodactylum tricornutum CCAP 1055/1]EEC47933.1 small ubiquitin-like modifier [Phaeodactylum tricornutum CCAP 1055/1]|eukprot:XP_002180525.1 small ubiquitin-like modifier [Phaeodactylum tricornutum CCAP 1055/1]